MTIDEQTLQQVVSDVCSGMLGLQLTSVSDAIGEEADALSAVIRISGGRETLVQVLTPRNTAVTIASRMFAAREHELSEAEIRDAVGEIVNMVAGSLKGIIDGASGISLPCVGESTGCSPFDDSFSGVCVVNRCQGDPLTVRVFERGTAAAADRCCPDHFRSTFLHGQFFQRGHRHEGSGCRRQ